MYTITDEELNTSGQLDQDPRYTVRDNNGNVLYDNVKIELKTPVSVEGTDINKATLEGIQTDLMNETELVVAEYTATANVSSIEFTGLDFENDGGFYEIIADIVPSSNQQLVMQINDINDNVYYYGSSNENKDVGFHLGTTRDYSQHTAYLTAGGGRYLLHSHYLYINSTLVQSGYATGGFLISQENITKLTFYLQSSATMKTGTNIKIIKRR